MLKDKETCMQHLQRQKDVDWAHQMLRLYTVPSYGYHRGEVAYKKGSQQSKYSLYKSAYIIKWEKRKCERIPNKIYQYDMKLTTTPDPKSKSQKEKKICKLYDTWILTYISLISYRDLKLSKTPGSCK